MTTDEETSKNAYGEKVQASLDQWKAELDKLEAKARESKADAKIELQQNVEEVKAHWKTARDKAEEMQKASGEAWKELKAGTESALHSLKDAVDRARMHLR